MSTLGLSDALLELADSLDAPEDHELRELAAQMKETIGGRKPYQESLALYKKALELLQHYQLELEKAIQKRREDDATS